MKTKTKIVMSVILYAWIVSFTSCSNSTGGPGSTESSGFPHNEGDAIMMLSTAFSGLYKEAEIKGMMDSVMTIYKIPLGKDNYMRVGNQLITLRKESKTGICEMDILKSMINAAKEKNSTSFEELAVLLAKSLEMRNNNPDSL